MSSKACLAGSTKQKNILKLNSARDVEILTAELMFKNSLLQINHKCAPFWSFYPGKDTSSNGSFPSCDTRWKRPSVTDDNWN